MIKVTNSADSKVIYSICQADFTWAAAVNTDSAGAGAYTLNAQIFNLDYTQSSSIESVALSKGATVCTEANEAALYANYGAGGDGEGTPYIICNSEQFLNMRFAPTKKFVLGQNVDFSNRIIAPMAVPFKGELDGNGYRISNFIVKDLTGAEVSVGLFRYAHDAVIKDLEIKNAIVDGYQRVGILAGDWRGSGTIQNVKVQGKSSGITYVGGLIGLGNTSSNLNIDNVQTEIEVIGNNYVGGTIGFIVSTDGNFLLKDSTIMSKVSGIDYIGGVVGRSLDSSFNVQNSKHIGDVLSQGKWVGGFAGELVGGAFTDAQNVGKVQSTKDAQDIFVGGYVGESRNLLTVTNSESVSDIASGGNYTGGFVGKTHSLTATNFTSRGTINVEDDYYANSIVKFVGGVAGGVSLNSTIADAKSFVDITAKAYYVGGLVGTFNGDNSQITNSYYKGDLSAYTSNVGGLVGVFSGNLISNSFSDGNISVQNPTPLAFIGGLVGEAKNSAANYTRLYSKSDITITNGIADYVGGLFGYVDGVAISEGYHLGTISGSRSKVGGIAGYTKADINLSYAASTIDSDFRYIGGIAGIALNASINDSFVLGSLEGKGEVGGIAGWLEGASNQVARSYFVGSIVKKDGSTFGDSTFGNITGIKSAGSSLADVFYASTNTINDHLGSALSANSEGVSLTSSQLRNTVYYTNYNFDSSNWTAPQSSGYKLPFLATDYLYARPSWLSDANQGFEIPTVFDNDPLQRNYASIFIDNEDSLSNLNQDHLAALDSSDPVTTVTNGNLELTVLEPSTNGQVVSGKFLVYGECGQPGKPVVLAGDVSFSSVCQDNNRWGAVIDSALLPVGTINFNVSLKSLDYSQSSTAVNKSVVKSGNLCDQEDAVTGAFANSFQGADGNTTPFKICHAGHFANIAYYPDKKFELINDIDFAGNTITPIKSVFTGELDGKNHVIKNYVINKATSVGVGLFSIINNATVQDLTIENANVTGYERVGLLAGSWVGQGTISGLDIKGDVTGILYTGGLFGLGNTSVDINMSNSSFEVNVQGNNFTGGVLGHVSTLGGTFVATNLTLKNTVNGRANVGGFIGSMLEPNMTLTNISQTGNITASKENVGGIAGHVRGGTYRNLTVNGDVSSSLMAEEVNLGGIFGDVELTTFDLDGASYTGNITSGGDATGGVIGSMQYGLVKNIQSHGNLSVNETKYNSVRSYTGGLVGHITEDATLTDSFSDMIVNAKSQYTGGLVGRFHGDTSVFKNSYYTGDLTASTAFIGGIAGFFFGEELHDSYSEANITVNTPTPDAYIGGLVGYANSWTSDYQRLSAEGNITITSGIADYVGGLIGYFRGGSLQECYAVGNITGARTAVGGVVGLSRGLTQFCYSDGDLSASFRHAGGIVGYLFGGEVKDSFTHSNVSGGSESGGVVGLSNSTANSISNTYAYNTVTRLDGSATLSDFGPILGKDLLGGSVTATNYYLDTNYTSGHNTDGASLTSAQQASSASYVGFDFSSQSHWRVPDAGYMLPGDAVAYDYPIVQWLGAGSQVDSFLVTGTVSGLNYSTVTLDLNGVEQVVINENQTNFSFTTSIQSGNNYTVSIVVPGNPTGVECTLVNESGVMGSANVTNVQLNCPSLLSISVTPSTLSIGNGENHNFTAEGQLSNSVAIDLTNSVVWTSSNPAAGTIATDGLFTTAGLGSTTITASVIGLNANSSVSVLNPISEATTLAWTESSPHNGLTINATWVKSASGNLLSQELRVFENASCSGAAKNTYSLGSSEQSYAYSGEHTKTYSFLVNSTSVDGVSKISACSNSVEIQLDTPDGVSSLATAVAWVSGASPISSPVVSWVNPGDVQNIKIGLGSSFGATDVVAFTSIGTGNNYTFTGLNSLTECSPYFPVVKVVDSNSLESDPVVDTVGFRWDNTAPAAIASVSVSGDATETSTGQFSWAAPTDNCALRFYELAIGTTPGADDVSGGFKPIGNVTNFTAVSGLMGFNLSLQQGVDYYTSVRAVDYANNRAPASTSASWQIINLEDDLPNLILWLDSEDKDTIEDNAGVLASNGAFNNKVSKWIDKSNSTHQHDFTAVSTAAEPYFTNDRIFFNGSAHYFTTPNHNEINLQTVQEKNITFSIKTENNINDKQVIYEEGGTVRGMNIYIADGKLYCGFWNVPDDGDGAQAFVSVSTNISTNKTYHVSWVFDYSNYAGASGPDGSLECFVNNNSIGSTTSTTRVYPHSGAIGIGGMRNDTYFHDGASSGDGHFFRGEILEVMITNESVDASVVNTIHNYLSGKWSVDDLSKPNSLATSNNSTATQSAIATWEAIDPALFTTDSYEVAIGTTPGGTEVVFWTNIGNVLTYQFQNGVDGASFSLSESVDYYFSVRAKDTIGGYSQVASSDPWQLFNFANDVESMVVDYDFSDLTSVQDNAGNLASSGSFNGNVNTIFDFSSSSFTHDTTNLGSGYPTFNVATGEISFNGVDNYVRIPNSDEINTALLAEKNITISFTTSASTSNRQMIYEEGGGTRGMNIYIEGHKLYCGFWNRTDDGDGAQDFIAVSKDINPSTDYVVTWRFDYSNFTSAAGEDGKLDCFLNTEYMGSSNTTTRIYPHGGRIGFGGVDGSSYYHAGSSGTNRSYFEGSVRRLIINNKAMRADKVQQLHYTLGF